MSFVEIFSAVTRGDRPLLHTDALHDTNVHNAAHHAAVMQQCLQSKPIDRPSFADIYGTTTTSFSAL
jgi:hypothetical protein